MGFKSIIKRINKKLFLFLLGKEGQLIWDRLQQIYVTNMNHANYGMIGNHCELGYEQISVPHNVFMEDYSRIQDHLNFISYKGKLIVKKYAAIGAGCTIIPGDHVPTVGLPQYLAGKLHINDVDKEIIVGEDSWIGAGSILLSHCKIGRGAVVAAGAVVSKPVPPYAVVAGVPAKIIATRFSIDQIIKHESVLYPEKERLSKEELELLFTNIYLGKPVIGKSDMPKEAINLLKKTKKELGMFDYSEQN